MPSILSDRGSVVGDFQLAGHEYFLVRGPNGEITNSWIEEDASPTALQSAEGAPDAASVPTATVEYNSFGGNIGLDSRVRAPGDFTRFYQTDWDATRGTQASAWVQWPGDVVQLKDGPGGTAAGVQIPGATSAWPGDLAWSAIATIDDPLYTGFVSVKTGAVTTGEVYKWDAPSGNFLKQAECYAPQVNRAASYLSGQTGSPAGQYFLPISQPVVMANGGRWYADASGAARNLLTNGTSVINPAVCTWLAPFYDFIAAFGQNGIDSYVTGYKPVNAAAGSMGDQIYFERGTFNGVSTINSLPAISEGFLYGQSAIFGAVSCEGVLWVATLNGVWSVQWSDEYNIFRIEELVRSLRVTGPPVNWNQEIYIPCGNRLAHIKPGQGPPDYIKLDQFDTMKPPWNGRIVECIPTTDALYCKVVEEGALKPMAATAFTPATAASVRAAIVRFDAGGVWSCVYPDMSPTSTLARMPLVRTFDAINPPGIGYFVDGKTIRLIPAQ